MDRLLRPGRLFFAASIAVFGAEYIHYHTFAGGLPPMPPFTPGAPALAYVVGAFLILTAIAIVARTRARLSATLIGALFCLCALIMIALRTSAVLHDGTMRTRAFEPLALGAAAWILAGLLPREQSESPAWTTAVQNLAHLGRYIFAVSMIVFGIQHFMYAGFIAALVTPWIPAHIVWVYLAGAGMIAVGLAMLTRQLERLAAICLGLMFLLWVIVLHAPRVFAATAGHRGDEFTSLFVALAFSGASFIIAARASKARNH
jgi:uncharacterized membrane protein